MKKKPLSIKIIALGYLLAPIVNVALVAWLNHWPLRGPRSVFLHLSFYDCSVLACFPLIGAGIFFVSRLGNIAFLAFSAFLIGHNTISYFRNPIYSIYVMLLFNMASLGIVGFFLQKHIWQAYYNPGLRWWTHPYRYKTSLHGVIRLRQIMVDAEVLDVSQGGCFIRSQNIFKLGDTLEITLSQHDFELTLKAQVAWSKIEPSRGYGLMFTHLNKNRRRELLHFIALIKASVQVPDMPFRKSA